MVMKLDIPENCIAFQAGAISQILSGGKSSATLHYMKCGNIPNIFRLSFALFYAPIYRLCNIVT